MLKQLNFWRQMPHEKLLIVQTDTCRKTVRSIFLQFFHTWSAVSSKTAQRILHHEKRRGTYRLVLQNRFAYPWLACSGCLPHLHGNGGLSIRSRTTMETICERWGKASPDQEAEDVFQSSYQQSQQASTAGYRTSLATETTYNPNTVGSHACRKFLKGSELANHFEQHLREAWAMTTALRNQTN